MPKKPVGNTFLENVHAPTLFGKECYIGEIQEIDERLVDQQKPQLFYHHPHGELWCGDSLIWLTSLEQGSVDLIFADPPYNIGKVDWDRFESHDDYISWSVRWIELAARALKPTGTLYVCGFSEVLADIHRPAMQFFYSSKWLVWFYKNKANLTKDWGRSHESILHFRKGKNMTFHADIVRIPYGNHTLKYPVHPQAESSQYGKGRRKNHWVPHPNGAKPKDVFEIPVTSNGMIEKTPHPTQKPEELLRRIILASSDEEDLVVDPFSGSGTTVVCAEQLNRRWAGCDINQEYNSWAVIRLENIPRKTIEEWVETDRTTARRRESIR